jgi:Na+/H+-translocating membrane pyrophosphatase
MINPISAGIQAVSGYFSSRENRKQNKESGIAKLKQMKVSSDTEVTLSDAESEAIMAGGLNDTWKDEYVTILITAPYALLILGSVYLAFTDDSRMLTAAIDSINGLETVGVDIGFLMEAVVLGAIGLKIWRR